MCHLYLRVSFSCYSSVVCCAGDAVSAGRLEERRSEEIGGNRIRPWIQPLTVYAPAELFRSETPVNQPFLIPNGLQRTRHDLKQKSCDVHRSKGRDADLCRGLRWKFLVHRS